MICTGKMDEEINQTIIFLFSFSSVLRRIQPFPFVYSFRDAPFVVGGFCFLQIFRTYGAFDATKRIFVIPKRNDCMN